MLDVSRKHIEIVAGAGGPKPRIKGSRIRVQDIAIWHEKLGMPPDEIVQHYPQLMLADVHAAALRSLAGVGGRLYRDFFYGTTADAALKLLGDRLRELASGSCLRIQIVSQQFLLPWGLLYVGQDWNNPDPELFLGLKHIIEHIPLQTDMAVLDARITSVLAEVDRWTGFSGAFTHLHTGLPADDPRVVLTAVLADATNLGLTRMADACSVASYRKLAIDTRSQLSERREKSGRISSRSKMIAFRFFPKEMRLTATLTNVVESWMGFVQEAPACGCDRPNGASTARFFR